MIKIFGVFLLLGAFLSPVWGQATKSAASDDAQAIKKLEREWTAAQTAADVGKLRRILADDWMGLGADGNRSTKAEFLEDIKSGASKLTSFEFGPMDVKVLGTVAIVQGSDTEKSTTKGEDTTGKWVWMDVFEKRDGKWVAVRSQSAMVK